MSIGCAATASFDPQPVDKRTYSEGGNTMSLSGILIRGAVAALLGILFVLAGRLPPQP